MLCRPVLPPALESSKAHCTAKGIIRKVADFRNLDSFFVGIAVGIFERGMRGEGQRIGLNPFFIRSVVGMMFYKQYDTLDMS